MIDDAAKVETIEAEGGPRRPAAKPSCPSGVRERAVLPPGTVVGRYRTGEPIGAGGQGVVYRGEHFGLCYPVAIKVLRSADISSQQRSRIRREARLGAQVRHPNIVGVLDAGELEDGSPYFVMEHVDGVGLADLLADHTLSPAATVELGTQLLSALAALDARSIVHRDIKPENVMLRREVDGCVTAKLLDFGISKASDEDLLGRTVTRTGTLMGTPQYMSPEHVLGEELDVRSDLYAVAGVLYESISGEPPHDAAATGALIAKIATESVRPLGELAPSCPERLAEVIDRGLRRRREERWSHPLEMAEHLRHVAHELGLPRGAEAWPPGFGHPRPPESPPPGRRELSRQETGDRFEPAPPVAAQPPPSPPHRPRASSRRAMAVASTVAVAIIGAILWLSSDRAPASTPPTPSPATAPRQAPPIPPEARVEAATPVPARVEPAPSSEPAAEAASSTEDVAAGERSAVVRSEPRLASAIDPATRASRASSAPADRLDALERSAREAFVRGDSRAALGLYRRVIAQAPRRATAWRGLGLVSAAAGERGAARRALSRYLSLSPRAPDRARIERELAGLR